MEIAIFIAFILGCICLGCLNTKNDKAKKIFILVIWLSMLILYFLGLFAVIYKDNTIPAIEVYRDNTELQITYQDSIPIDSVVVYKNK